jgi:RHS repeat-associated protein
MMETTSWREVDSSGNVLVRYTQGDEIDEQLSQLRTGAPSFYQRDGTNSVTSLSNSGGALANTYSYDSFGKLTASTGTLANPFQYTGREFDFETGLYYYRARYYERDGGRFLSEDPVRLEAGPNFYSYVLNNPILYRDPFGWKPGDPYPTAQDAAVQALLDIIARSNENGWEYGGAIYKNWDGTYSYTVARTDKSPIGVQCGRGPLLKRFVGTYHSHPYNPLTNPYNPSPEDAQNASPGFNNWIVVFNGEVFSYDPNGNQQTIANVRPQFTGFPIH